MALVTTESRIDLDEKTQILAEMISVNSRGCGKYFEACQIEEWDAVIRQRSSREHVSPAPAEPSERPYPRVLILGT